MLIVCMQVYMIYMTYVKALEVKVVCKRRMLYVYIYIFIYIHIHTHTRTRMHTNTHTHTHTHVICVCVYKKCMYLHTYKLTHVKYMYMNTYKRTHPIPTAARLIPAKNKKSKARQTSDTPIPPHTHLFLFLPVCA